MAGLGFELGFVWRRACTRHYSAVTMLPRPESCLTLDCSPGRLRPAFPGSPWAPVQAWGQNNHCWPQGPPGEVGRAGSTSRVAWGWLPWTTVTLLAQILTQWCSRHQPRWSRCSWDCVRRELDTRGTAPARTTLPSLSLHTQLKEIPKEWASGAGLCRQQQLGASSCLCPWVPVICSSWLSRAYRISLDGTCIQNLQRTPTTQQWKDKQRN